MSNFLTTKFLSWGAKALSSSVIQEESAYSTTKSIPIPTANGSNSHLHPNDSTSMSQPRSIPRSNSVQTSDLPPFSTSPSASLLHRSGSISTSPTFSTIKQSSYHEHHGVRPPKVLHQLDSGDLKVLILENISQQAVNAFKDAGFQVDFYTKAWSEAELIEKIGQYHAIGIRSKTKITAKVLKAATKLLVIGCFCIGTNQVDLETAAKIGIPVFNSPFSNSRSVAELVMSEVIALSRQLVDRANEMRQGTWNKVSKGCWEVRGKTLGIVGYGHIGSQLSVLAEAFAMRVLYYDVLNIMPLGNATQVETLEDLLSNSDFVTLHVPELPETINMISTPQLDAMKQGAYLINNARGKVVDIPALIQALKSKKLAGAAIDVFPAEPGSNGAGTFNDQLNTWTTELTSLSNIILTPHIGGSTEEAQRAIGFEVSSAVTRYLTYGSTMGAVNFPEVDLRAISADQTTFVRICHVHKNEPGVLKKVNAILGNYNVEKQFSDSKGDVAYLMADISGVSEKDVHDLQTQINQTRSNILTRLLS